MEPVRVTMILMLVLWLPAGQSSNQARNSRQRLEVEEPFMTCCHKEISRMMSSLTDGNEAFKLCVICHTLRDISMTCSTSYLTIINVEERKEHFTGYMDSLASYLLEIMPDIPANLMDHSFRTCLNLTFIEDGPSGANRGGLRKGRKSPLEICKSDDEDLTQPEHDGNGLESDYEYVYDDLYPDELDNADDMITQSGDKTYDLAVQQKTFLVTETPAIATEAVRKDARPTQPALAETVMKKTESQQSSVFGSGIDSSMSITETIYLPIEIEKVDERQNHVVDTESISRTVTASTNGPDFHAHASATTSFAGHTRNEDTEAALEPTFNSDTIEHEKTQQNVLSINTSHSVSKHKYRDETYPSFTEPRLPAFGMETMTPRSSLDEEHFVETTTYSPEIDTWKAIEPKAHASEKEGATRKDFSKIQFIDQSKDKMPEHRSNPFPEFDPIEGVLGLNQRAGLAQGTYGLNDYRENKEWESSPRSESDARLEPVNAQHSILTSQEHIAVVTHGEAPTSFPSGSEIPYKHQGLEVFSERIPVSTRPRERTFPAIRATTPNPFLLDHKTNHQLDPGHKADRQHYPQGFKISNPIRITPSSSDMTHESRRQTGVSQPGMYSAEKNSVERDERQMSWKKNLLPSQEPPLRPVNSFHTHQQAMAKTPIIPRNDRENEFFICNYSKGADSETHQKRAQTESKGEEIDYPSKNGPIGTSSGKMTHAKLAGYPDFRLNPDDQEISHDYYKLNKYDILDIPLPKPTKANTEGRSTLATVVPENVILDTNSHMYIEITERHKHDVKTTPMPMREKENVPTRRKEMKFRVESREVAGNQEPQQLPRSSSCSRCQASRLGMIFIVLVISLLNC